MCVQFLYTGNSWAALGCVESHLVMKHRLIDPSTHRPIDNSFQFYIFRALMFTVPFAKVRMIVEASEEPSLCVILVEKPTISHV